MISNNESRMALGFVPKTMRDTIYRKLNPEEG
jgi:hypothetical protein